MIETLANRTAAAHRRRGGHIKWMGPAIGWALAAGLLVADRSIQGQAVMDLEAARARMVEHVVKGSGVTDERVLRAMRQTPRHEFVDRSLWPKAYYDMALPIGAQQTISSPFIVAFMTQSLDPKPTDKVLEVGTGSGYQAAVLSPLVKEVYTIEIVESLGRKAAQTLTRLGYANVHTRIGDGFLGWPEAAPFDKIIVTCSPEKPPQPLIDQLAEGGIMVIPVGERYQQTLYVMRKEDGKLIREALRPTLFVPMTGEAEQQREVLPDAANPKVVNGDFEEAPQAHGFVPGWYYQRQLTWESDSRAPKGSHYITFSNRQYGRPAHLLQGFPIDGREVAELEMSAWVRTRNVRYPRGGDFPCLAVTFYDENRRDLGVHWIGPFSGSSPWRHVRKRIRVPADAREGILRVGLFGATGELSFDDVVMRPSVR